MQLTHPRGNIIEKVLRNANGQLVRVVFCVYETQGRVKARVLYTTVLGNQSRKSSEILALGGFVHAKKIKSQEIFYNSIVFPFLTSNSIYFSGSKPRAPTTTY